MRETWNDYNQRQDFEHELIDRKTTWLLATQTILFAAYGFTFQNESASASLEDFRGVVAWSGLSIAVIVFTGVFTHIWAKRQSWKDYKGFFEKEAADFFPLDRGDLQWGVRTPWVWPGLVPDILLPIVFVVGWSVVLAKI